MIRFILLQNRAGKTRLAKYYVPLEDSEKRHLEYDVHRLIAGETLNSQILSRWHSLPLLDVYSIHLGLWKAARLMRSKM